MEKRKRFIHRIAPSCADWARDATARCHLPRLALCCAIAVTWTTLANAQGLNPRLFDGQAATITMNVAQSYKPGASGRTPLTQGKLDEGVKKYYEHCAINTTYLRNLHDCRCLTEGYKQSAIARGSTIISIEDDNRIGQTCPAPKATTYAWVYKTCDDFMQHRRADHAQFCGCTADRFSTAFRNKPNSNTRKVEALRKESMIACGL